MSETIRVLRTLSTPSEELGEHVHPVAGVLHLADASGDLELALCRYAGPMQAEDHPVENAGVWCSHCMKIATRGSDEHHAHAERVAGGPLDRPWCGICVNHDCDAFERPVEVSNLLHEAEQTRCLLCNQLLCHQSGLLFKDWLEQREEVPS